MHVSRFWVALLFPVVLMVQIARVTPCEKHKHGAAEVTMEEPAPAAQSTCQNNWSPITLCVPQPQPQEDPQPAQTTKMSAAGHVAHNRMERSQPAPCVEEQTAHVEYTCRVSTPAATASAAHHHHSYGASVQQRTETNTNDGNPANPPSTQTPAEGPTGAAGPSTAAASAMVPVIAILASMLA